jgi:hypothetical protein
LQARRRPSSNEAFRWLDDAFAAQSWLVLLVSMLVLFGYSRPPRMLRRDARMTGPVSEMAR